MKWLFTDYDGTLKNPLKKDDKDINEYDLKWINEFQSKGNKIVLISGRSFLRIKKPLKDLYNFTPDFFISSTGSTIHSSDEKILFSYSIEENKKVLILNKLKPFTNRPDFNVMFVTTPKIEKCIIDNVGHSQLFEQMMIPYNEDREFKEIINEEIINFKFFMSKELWSEVQNSIAELNMDYSQAQIGDIFYPEIIKKGISKANAIHWMKENFNISGNDLLVAGDDFNDLTMFKDFYEHSYIVCHPENKSIQDKAKFQIDKISDIKF
ncbi:HAD-IIB family hydrolase [Spiroplasma culicicola]|uniref:HAD superfamily hydrolase n=1 Tax=Spiroplasma culicicola AES-1 TaxID=1276246 RepID=W6A5U0_9MOLU|nr:HAD-IIB family hydrolase [Spiroplasma culicicola]AHI52357.1 hypothetical protein SCULI_v1c00160 [Spiroplasma culicicola AES-1]